MPTLKDFIEALGVSWPIALVAVIGSGGTLAAHYFSFPYADQISPIFLATALVVLFFSVGVCVVKIIQLLIRAVHWVIETFQRRSLTKFRVSLLSQLPDEERRILAYLLSQNKQSFPYPYGEARLVGLIEKGLLYRPGGAYQQLAWPHTIPDEIWLAMKREPQKFAYDVRSGNPLKSYF